MPTFALPKFTADGVMLTEVAPGIDVERDVVGQMEFRPIIAPNLAAMDERIFKFGRLTSQD